MSCAKCKHWQGDEEEDTRAECGIGVHDGAGENGTVHRSFHCIFHEHPEEGQPDEETS